MKYFGPFKLGFWLLLNALLLAYFARSERTDGLSFWDMSNSPHLFEDVNGKGLMMYMVIAVFLESNVLNLAGMSYARAFGKPIPVRARHLDEPSIFDQMEVSFNQAIITPSFYIYCRIIYFSPTMVWGFQRMTLMNTVGGIVVLLATMEFFYYWMHRISHHPRLYPYMHKPHHAQLAPTRGWDDGLIGSPIEFVMTNLFHHASIPLGLALTGALGLEIHAFGAFPAEIIGALLGIMNHTRYEVSFSILGFEWFNSACHDVHHRIPGYNFSIYTLVWDKVFGTYRPINHKEGFQADMQIDEKTGKSIAYSRNSNRSVSQ